MTGIAATPHDAPSAAETDPLTLGLMQGFPPPPEKTARVLDGSFRAFPMSRWSFSNIRQTVPTKAVWRGAGGAVPLPRAEQDLSGLPTATMDGRPLTFAAAMDETYADGVLVLHRGRIVFERYAGALAAHRPHLCMSVTKSFVGAISAALAVEGVIDPAAPVTRYVPELGASAFGDASLRQVLDMTTGLKYNEIYGDPNSDIARYRLAGSAIRDTAYSGPQTYYDYLVTLEKEGGHDDQFVYKTVNTEVLGWILRRATGTSLADLVSERLWQKLGCEEDGYFLVDSIGTEGAGGGLNVTLRDMARFGECMRCGGAFNGHQVIPEAAVADIAGGADPAKFAPAGYATLPGWSYRNQWWVSHNEHGAYMARGIHGQSIYVDPKAEMVIVRFASHPLAGNVHNDPVTLPAFMAVAKHLMG
ncbi:serine hydrolase domain-containing protein [Phreatobacter sp.]|uniref:serine hydrolase domain-containing protein n=1 Tax=Phreatobacter sp. TaxID=1966341 RepID=UPI003F7107E9